MRLFDSGNGQLQVLIIGAGVGGLTTAIALKSKLNYRNFIIVEKADDIGGTWRENIYPGCASDVHVHFYSLSSDLNPNWTTNIAGSDEIKQYWSGLVKKYGLTPHLVFNTKVTAAEWDEDEQLWSVKVEDTRNGQPLTVKAKVVISANGLLHIPKIPKTAGLEKFKGKVFHSAKWDYSVDLKGKSVGVIGNGASATQFVPYISEDPSTQVTHFCRTPNWLIPFKREQYGSTFKWIAGNIPFFIHLWRFILFLRFEFLYLAIFRSSVLRALTTKVGQAYIRIAAPKEYRDKLVPNYTLGCKRILFDTGYLRALHRPNLKPTWDGIRSIDERGIVTTKGQRHDLDVLIFATGFVTNDFPFEVKGIDGLRIHDYYESQQAATAYLGTTVPGFPNFCMLAGPNTATGHTSVIFFEEVQADYIVQLLTPILHRTISSFNVKHSATDAYNDRIQARLSRSVHVGCSSWYKKDGTGKNASIFPG
ncbi:hypothetical protein AX16_010940 [Volvariella volvacea WC 439]|nr:hypothetical protein AX16_010940 [Volvariella volvacea WC 439]